MSDRRGERLYRLLCRAYPRSFLAEYEPALLELFRYRREEWRARRGRLGPAFWAFIARDVAASAWRERRAPLPARQREGVTTTTGGEGMRGWAEDLWYATRRLARAPGFALTAVTILVLGIGVNTAAFAVVNALLIQEPPFDEPDRVVLVLQDSDDGEPNSTSYPAFLDIARYDAVFEAVSAFSTDQVFVEENGELRPMLVEYATSGYLATIGLPPSRGRWFDPSSDDRDGPPAAVLTHRMWRDRLGSDPDVIGRMLRIGGQAIPIVGVGPEPFNGGVGPAPVDLWLSISAMAPTGGRAASLDRRQDHPFQVRARLAPGVGREEAGAAMDRLAEELAATYPGINTDRDISVLPGSAPPDVRARILPAAALTMSVVVVVLLIATLNLANLLLVRTAARTRELAVRLALGASRGRVARVVLSEALVLAGVGCAGALLLAGGAMTVIGKSRFDFGLPTSLDVRLDVRVLFFAVALSVLAGLVFGLVPALRATSREVSSTLREQGAATIGARRRFGLTGALVSAQVAASLLLLAVAGVFVESLGRARGSDPGFDWEGTAFATVGLQPLGLDGEAVPLLHRELADRLRALPEVEDVTLAIQLPARMFGSTTLLLGAPVRGVDEAAEIPWNLVEPGYFETLGIPVLSGRTFEERDADGPTVAVVSETMATAFWGRTDVVGETYRSEGRPNVAVEIVGVVGDVPVRTLGERPSPAVYWSGAARSANATYVFRFTGPPDQALAAVRAAIRGVDDRILIPTTETMAGHLGTTLGRQRLAGGLLGALGALALLLAVLGVYGVVSFAVSRRRSEVGIRIALGAGRDTVVRLFVRDVGAIVLAGGLVGLALAIPAARLVGAMFTGTPGSPLASAGAALLLVVTALLATVVPATRAARTDPTEALRRE